MSDAILDSQIWWGTKTRTSFGTLTANIVRPASIRAVTGDFDGDGRSDVFWINGASGRIWFGTPTRGSFTSVNITAIPSGVPITGDFDGDGRTDVNFYVAGAGADTIWWASATRGSFSSIGLVLLGLSGCAGSATPRAPEVEATDFALKSRSAPSKPAFSDLVPEKDFAETLPPSVSCGTPCAEGEDSLRVGGSCLCVADVRGLTREAPTQDRWFVARGESLVEAERSPLKACGEAPLEQRGSREALLGCPWSGRELRVRTQQQYGVATELQAVPLPPSSALVGVFRDNPFSSPPGLSSPLIFVVWRVLLPETDSNETPSLDRSRAAQEQSTP